MSHISSPTLTAWLGSLGVRHFETQEPADLEYDPQLRVVAEWREVPALRADKYKADHAAVKERLETFAAVFQKTHHYSPPYWELVRLATQALAELRSPDSPPGPASGNPPPPETL